MGDYDPQALFERLHAAGVDYVLIGGWAVNAHGYRRYTGDVDICPAPAIENLERLARLLADLGAVQLGLEDFEPNELPGDPADPRSLAEGGNFRVATQYGTLDVMQWIPGIDAVSAYQVLAAEAISEEVEGIPIVVCSLRALRLMKAAAGRERDLDDLKHLPDPDGPHQP